MIEVPLYTESRESLCGSSPVFLIGAQRSGTTALAAALSRAFAAAGGSFTVNGKLPYLLRRWWTQDDLGFQHLRADEVEHALRRVPVGGVDAEVWLDRASAALRASAVRGAEMQRAVTVKDEVRLICEQAYGTQPWGDKYNEYLLELPWLSHVFPSARWIFLVREPSDVIASMLAWRREKAWNPLQASAAAAKWAAWNDCWLRFRGSLEPARTFEVGYEQLVGDRGRQLSEWLGLDVMRHLGEFDVRRYSGCIDLTPHALNIRQSLVRQGLLAEDKSVSTDVDASPGRPTACH